MTVFQDFISKAEQYLRLLFHDEQAREEFLDFTLKYSAENEGEEVGKFAWALMKRVVPELLPREIVLRIHMTDPMASEDILAEIVPVPTWRPCDVNHRIHAGLRNLVRKRIELDLRPLLSMPEDVAEATGKLDGKAALARRGHKRRRLLDEFSMQARGALLEALENPAARAQLDAKLNAAMPDGRTRRERLIDHLLDRVLPTPIPRGTTLQLLMADADVCKEEIEEHGWMQMMAAESIDRAILEATRPTMERFYAMHGYPDPSYADKLSPDR